MRLPKTALHLLILAISTAWGLLLAYNLNRLGDYYIRSGITRFEGGVFTCWREYSPSLTFILFVFLPAIVLLALYLHFRSPALWRAGVELGLTTLTVVLVPLKNPWWAFQALIPFQLASV